MPSTFHALGLRSYCEGMGGSKMKKTDDEYARARPWLVRAALLSGVSGLIHMVLTPVYFAHWLGYGAFFFLASVGQFSYAAVLAVNPPNRLILWTGIAGNALIIAIWAITRMSVVSFLLSTRPGRSACGSS